MNFCAKLVLVLATAFVAMAQPSAGAPTFTADGIGTTARIPSVGRPVTYTVRLRTPAGQPIAGNARVSLEIEDRPVAEKEVHLQLAVGGHHDVSLEWTPRADGWYRQVFRVIPAGWTAPSASVEQRVPVTDRPLVFLWFGAPQHLKWCNAPTTVEPKDRAWWQWRGARPCGWKGGICYQEWSVAQFTESYNDWPWIAIDEIGPDDETGRKILAAIRAHKQAHPEGCRALWSIGVHDYWREAREYVDLFVPEIYLNYGDNHLGKIDEYVRRTRQVGCMDRMIPGLGINVVKYQDKRPPVVPTREDVLRQIRRLKAVAPDLSGVGFFTATAATGVAEYADELCREYYLDPVLTVVPGSLVARVNGEVLELAAAVRNHGGMTARGVLVEFGEGFGTSFRPLTKQTVAELPPLREAVVQVTLALQPGVRVYGLRLVPPAGIAVLEQSSWTMASRGSTPAECVVYQPPTETSGEGLPLFAEALTDSPVSASWTLAPDGRRAAAVPATVLPGLPGDPAGVVTWTPISLPPGRPAAFELNDDKSANSPATLQVVRSGEVLQVNGAGCVAKLDLAKDQVLSLKAHVDGPELLSSPWAFTSTGYTGFQASQVKELPGGLLVTVPFTNPRAEGFSRYFFYTAAAVIRIERFFVPRGELQVTESSEGCGLPQRGGVFALQPGEDGLVRRGQLLDSSDYRDLLFGYLGSSPSPENARLAGWFDCAFTRDGGGGLGVAIERRWEAARSDVGYDVTRYYDGGDSLSVLNLWGKELKVSRPQTQILYLLPHGPLPLDEPSVAGPAQRLWRLLHTRARMAEPRPLAKQGTRPSASPND